MQYKLTRTAEHVAVGIVSIDDNGKSKELFKGFGLNQHQLELVKLELETSFNKGRASAFTDIKDKIGGIAG